MAASKKKKRAVNASSAKNVTLSSQLLSLYRKYSGYISVGFAQRLAFDPRLFYVAATIAFVAEIYTNIWIIRNVKYTEIDWGTYMQQVKVFLGGTYDYSKLVGDTGPIVYPAGYVYVFFLLYKLTQDGTNVQLAQYVFMVVYLATLVLVFRIYHYTMRVPPYMAFFLCFTSYRIHSIYVLRLFNDPVAMLFFYAAVNCALSRRWTCTCALFSLAVSIKMNILLFSPALFFLLLGNLGYIRTGLNLAVCALIQVVLAGPFLLTNPEAYIRQSFDFGRVFLYEWTVNWRFLPEDIFTNRYFHLALLGAHLVVLIVFLFANRLMFTRKSQSSNSNNIVLPLFAVNLIGIAFSRSLHYQFYVWYYHSLPFLYWSTQLPIAVRLCSLGLIELSWNVFPSTVWSSALLHCCHVLLLVSVWRGQAQTGRAGIAQAHRCPDGATGQNRKLR